MLVILGNQLFPLRLLPPASSTHVFMAEDVGLCTYEKHHQQKIVLFLAAMRSYHDELRAAGYSVHYIELDASDSRTYEQKLADAMQQAKADSISHFEVEDKPMERRLVEFAKEQGFEREEFESPMFTCTRAEFAEFAAGKPRLLMADFYKEQRRKLSILLDDDGQPTGGQWSFDAENRKKLPRDLTPPEIPAPDTGRHVEDVIKLVRKEFADHPGNASEFWWPVTRDQARQWLDDFIANRLGQFGPYEDAMTTRSATVFHSLLSPCMNMGLLTPEEVIDKVMARADEQRERQEERHDQRRTDPVDNHAVRGDLTTRITDQKRSTFTHDGIDHRPDSRRRPCRRASSPAARWRRRPRRSHR